MCNPEEERQGYSTLSLPSGSLPPSDFTVGDTTTPNLCSESTFYNFSHLKNVSVSFGEFFFSRLRPVIPTHLHFTQKDGLGIQTHGPVGGIKAGRAHPCSIVVGNVNMLHFTVVVVMLFKKIRISSFQGNNQIGSIWENNH